MLIRPERARLEKAAGDREGTEMGMMEICDD
jgi:hypothetical protein